MNKNNFVEEVSKRIDNHNTLKGLKKGTEKYFNQI